MKLTIRSWFSFLGRLFPRSQTRSYRKRQQLRRFALQGLEPRQLLSASIEVFNGSTQFSNGYTDSFGTVTVGSSDVQNLTLKNVGDATLTVSSDSLPYGYSTTTSLPLSIAPGNSANFEISLNTNSVGNYYGQGGLSSNDPNNSYFGINFMGTVQSSSGGGTITVSENGTQLSNGGNDSFGTVSVGASDYQTFNIQNTGSGTLTVSSVSLPSGYTLNTSLPLSIGAEQSQGLQVSMSTSTPGTFSGQMLIESSDTSHNPFTINVSGTVSGSGSPVIGLQDGSTTIYNGGSDSFGSVAEGSADTRTYTVSNQGSGTLTVSSISLTNGYSLQTSLPLNVAAGGSTTFVVALGTSSVGSFSTTMGMISNSTQNSTFNVNLSGTVTVPAAPVMSLEDGSTTISNGGSDSFGSVTQGTQNYRRTFTVNNTGNASLSVSAVNLPSGFTLETTMPLPSIAAGSSGTFVVQMDTATIGNVSGAMSITDTDTNNNPYTVSLSGTVTTPPPAPVMSLADAGTTISNGGSDSFGSVTQGTQNYTRTFTVNNTGNASLSVSAVNLPSGFTLETTMPLPSIVAGSSGTFVVQMDTATVGNVSGAMSITDTDTNNNPYTVSLSGTVTSPPAGVNIQASVPTTTEREGSPAQFTVTRSTSSSSPLTVNYAVSGTATPGVDYTALSGTVTIGADMTTATISVAPLMGGDIDEVQQIVLPSPTGGTYRLATGSDTTTALAYNADAAAVAAALAALPSVGVGRVTVTGSGTSASPFVVTFHGPLGGPAPAQIVGDGSQLTGGASTGSGTGGITTSVTTVGDDGGTVVATLSSSSNYTIGSPSYDTVTIIGAEPPVVTVVATTPQADEVAGTPGVFTLYRNGPTINSLTVNYTLGGTTLDGVDYDWVSGSVTFAAGQSTATVDITPIDNGLPGPPKTVVLAVSASQGGQGAYDLAGASSDTVTIADSNLPIVTIQATTPTADEETPAAGEFTVSRIGDLTDPLTVNYTVAGTAVAGSQYQTLSGSVTIPAGQGYATIDITPIDDGGEGTDTSSTVALSLASSSSYQIGSGGTDTVTITDDDMPQVSIAASTPLAVESTAAPGAFTISIASPLTSDLTIPYTVSGTAISGTDFQPLSGSATIPAGQTSVVVQVLPLSDPAEIGFTTVQVNLGSGGGYELTTSKTAIVSIVGNMSVPTVTLAASTPVADEIAGTNGVFTATRTGSTANALTGYYTIAGTAVDGTDYDLLPGSFTIPAGQTSTTILITPLNDPAMQDSSRTVMLNLTNYGGPSGAGYSIGNPGGDTVTIDDLPTVTLAATTATAQEHELTPGIFTVTRANDPLEATQALTVNYTIAGTAVNGTDYQTLSGSATIPAGQPNTTIALTPIDMDLVGGSQTVTLTLANGNYLIGSPTNHTVTIDDDDLPTVGIQATTPTASEVAGAPGVFTVTRNGPTTAPLTVSYSVSGTGVAGTNYQALSSSVTIPAGSGTATINVTPINIGEVGGTFTVVATLSPSSTYALTAAGPTPAPQTSDTVTIQENDLPTVMLSATQAHATESGTTGTFTISRNGTTTNPLTVLYTIGGTATNGTDYQSLSGNVTIPAGQSSATITVTPINDPAVEQDQTVTLTLAATSQYLAGSQYSDTVTIFDDNLPSVTIAATANADEEAGTAGQFTVTRVGPGDNALTVNYAASGTAQSGTNFQPIGTSITIPAGQTSATIAVTPLDDNGTDEVQQIVIPPATGGTYTLSIGSNVTGALPYNASASAVQAALALLPEVGIGNVAATGQGTTASPFLVTFSGGLVSVDVPQITGDSSQLTGATSVSVATTTTGQRGFDQVEQVGYTATGTVTGGTFTLSFNGYTTPALAYNASYQTVQSALQALTIIGSGNVAVSTLSTGPDTYTWQVTFQGSFNDQSVQQIIANPSAITVSGGNATADDSIITQGSSGGGFNAVQQVTVTGAVGDTFTLTYQGATTAGIAYNATAAQVSSALQALSTIGMNDVSVSGNAGGPWSVTFISQLGDEPVPNMTANGSGLTNPPVTTSVVTPDDGDTAVVVTLATSSAYTIGTLANATASGGTGASDTVTIADNDNVAPSAAAIPWSTNIGQALSVTAPGVLAGAHDLNSNATLTAVLLTGTADGTLTFNSDGSFTYTPNSGFTGTDSFYFQVFDGSLYSAPEEVTIDVVPLSAPQISMTDGQANVADGGSVAFGQTFVGTAVTQTITISNPGTADLTLSSWTAPSGFSIVTAPSADVPAGGSTTMTVQMDATAAGSYSQTFSIDDNVAGESPFTFTLSGTVNNPAPVLEVKEGTGNGAQGTETLVDGGSFSFGTTGQDEPLTDAFTIENTGTANLVLSDPINLPAGFTVAQDFGATTLAPGASTTFAIELTATAPATYSGNLTFGSNDPNNPTYSLALSGTVVASPVVEALDGTTVIANNTSTPVDFGTALVGTALQQTITIENNGTTILDLNTSQLTLPAGYSVVTPYASTVAPGGSTTLVLKIDGSTAGTFSGSISFPTNDVDNATFSFPVTGTINTPEPQIEIFNGTTQLPAGGTIDFGTTQLGTPADVTLTIENVGTADLNLNPVVQLPFGYRLVSLGETDVPAGGSTTATLELVGGTSGTYDGPAEIDSDDPTTGAFDFTMSGTVVAPQAAITLGSTPVADGESDAPPAGSVDMVNFGATTLNTPVIDTFTVTNAGTGTLVLTDPIQVPMGFSVQTDFGATTLAPGASTTFSIELDAQTAGQSQGTVMVETNDPDHRLYRFGVSGSVAAATMTVTDSNAPATNLALGGNDDFGNTALATPVERTFTVTDTGTGVLILSDPINLPAGFTLVSDFGSTALQPGDSTSFTVELTATTAGFYGGSISFGTNAPLAPAASQSGSAGPLFSFGVSGGVAAARLDVLEGSTDVTSYDNAGSGNGTGTVPANLDFGETVVGTARDETFTLKNTGTANLVLSDPISLPAGFTLVSDFGATTLAPGASTTFTVALSAAAAGDVSGSISFGTNLSPLPPGESQGEGGPNPPPGTIGPTFSLPIQGEVIGLTNFRLWNDTGYSETDGLTSDPTVAGNLVGVPVGTTAQVQFQVNNDGNVDGSLESDGTLPFTFTPVGLTPGAVTVDARIHLVDSVLGDIYSDWTPLIFTLQTGTDAAPVVTDLALQTDSVPNASTPTSSVPNIAGSVLHDGNVAYMTVQVDTTGSGQADDTVTTDANGNFVYQPQNLAPGTYTFNFRAIEEAYPSGEIDGPWESFTFTLVTPNPPVVDKLSLANVTGPGTSTTTDPTLTGHVTADGNPQQVEVDFNYNGDGTVQDSMQANADGTFTFTPQNLPGGNQTIYVRAVNLDDNITGAWTTISFTLLTTQPPTVNTLALLDDTGSSGTDSITDDPTVTGTLAAALGMPASSVDSVTVEFDTNGDGIPDGSTVSDSNGDFTWTPIGIEPGTVTIEARAVITDPISGAELDSPWKSISFTYSTSAGPVVSSLSLAHPTGTDQTTGLKTAIDPTLSGTLSDGSELAAFLTVQYELSGDTQPDGSSITDEQGNFTFTPTGVSPGTVTIEVRGVTQDPQTGAEIDGAWTTITFELQQDSNGQAPTPPLVTDNLTSADEIAATVQQGAAQSVDAGLASFNTAIGMGSTPSGQIALGIGTYAALSGDYGGRVVTGSIYAFQNGSIPATVPSGSGGGSGSGLSGSSPVGLPSGTPITLPATFSTPQAANITLSNQPVTKNGTVGPGSAVTTGNYGGFYEATYNADPENSNITDVTIDVEFSYSYTNSMSGSFTETSGDGYNYGNTASGRYFYHYYFVGTITITPGATIYAGTFTLDENDEYSYSWTNTDISSVTNSTQVDNGIDTSSTSGSSSFSHHEVGSYSNGGGLANNDNSYVPTLSSTFTNNETDTLTTSNQEVYSYTDSSPTGSDVGGSTHNDSTSYTHNYFEQGTYTASALGWGVNAAFNDKESGVDTSGDTSNDNYSNAAGDGQINGGENAGDSLSVSFTNSEGGTYSFDDGAYQQAAAFHYGEQGSASDYDEEQGNASGNTGNVSSGGSFSYTESEHSNYSLTDDGTDNENGLNYTISGSTTYQDSASGTSTYQDGGSNASSPTPASISSDPNPGTSTGSYADYETDGADQTDTVSGIYTTTNSGTSDSGWNSMSESASSSYSSSGSDSQHYAGTAQNATDSWQTTGDDDTTGSVSGSFSNTPGTTSESGTYSDSELAHTSATDSSTSVNKLAAGSGFSSSATVTDSTSTTTTYYYQDSGTYTVSNAGESDTGSYNDTTLTSEEDSATNLNGISMSTSSSGPGMGTMTSLNADSYYESDYSSATSSYGESATYLSGLNGWTSGTFSTSNSETSTYDFTDTGANAHGQVGIAPWGPASLGSITNYSTGGYGEENGTYVDQGTFNVPYGGNGTRSTSFSESGHTFDSATGTGWGTYANVNQSGSYRNAAFNSSTDDGWETGWHEEANTNTGSTSFSDSASSTASSTQNDGGDFVNWTAGTYTDYSAEDQTSTGWKNGSTVTGSGITTNGTFGDDQVTVNQDGGSQTYTPHNPTPNFYPFVPQGILYPGPANDDYTDQSSASYHDDGTFNGVNSWVSSTASFSRSASSNSTSDHSETGAFVYAGAQGSYSGDWHNTTLSGASENGSYTNVPGNYTETGTMTADSLSTGSDSQQKSGGSTTANSHSDSATDDSTTSIHEGGSYTAIGPNQTFSLTNASDIHYTQDTTTSGGSQSKDTGTQPLLVGNQFEATGATDNYNTSYSASGESALANGTTTDTVSYSSSKYDTSTFTDSVSLSYSPWYATGSDTDDWTGNDTSEYFENGSYSNTNGVPTSKSMSFSAHALSNITDLGKEVATEPGDAGSSFTLIQSLGQTEEDWSSGTSTLASFSNNFTQKKSTWSSLSFSQQGDEWQPEVPGQVLDGVWGNWNDAPDLLGEKHSVTAMGRYGTVGSAPSPPPIGTASSTATANYTTSQQTTTSGVSSGGSQVSTSTSSTTTETDNVDQSAFLKAVSPSNFDPSQPNASGNLLIGYATSSEVDKHNGWNRFGTASLSYNDVASETDSYSYLSTTDTTPASDQPVYQYQVSRQMDTTTHETGSYTTNPLGTSGPPTADAPWGEYANLNDTLDQNGSATGSVSLHEVATATSGSWQSDYLGIASSSFTSDRTMSIIAPVGAPVGIDIPSGSYSMTGGKVEQSQISGWGSAGGGSFGVSWNFAAGMTYTELHGDVGGYPQGGTKTTSTSTVMSWGETVKEWGIDLGQPFTFTYTYGGATSGSGSWCESDGVQTPPLDPPDPPPYTLTAFLDDLQITLDGLGFIPGIGDALDIVNGVISLARGNNLDAALSFVSAIPYLGSVLGVGGKVLKHGDEVVGLVSKGIGKIDEVGGVGKIAGKADDLYDAGKNQLRIIDQVGDFPGCFFAGTLISTEYGQLPIEQVAAGYRVWGFNLCTARWELCEVLETYESDYVGEAVELTVAGHRVESTYHHPYWVIEGEELEARPRPEHIQAAFGSGAILPGRWVDAGDLRQGDVLLLKDGRRLAVEAVVIRHVAAKIYNFQVADLHNYAVGLCAVLVHNNCKVQPVQPYEVGAYGDLGRGARARASVGDGLDIDHIQSNASNIVSAQKAKADALSDAEKAAVKNGGLAVAVPHGSHMQSPTTGGRNTATQIAADVANNEAAVRRDVAAMLANAPVNLKKEAEAAAQKILEFYGLT